MATDNAMHQVRRVRYEMRFRRLEVVRVESLTPRMRRITLGGGELDGFESRGPADHVKVFFPPAGEAEPALPSLGPEGRPVPPADGRVSPRRDFTPRRFDAERRELDLDFVLHGAGPAASWAAAAAPGSALGIGGPRGSKLFPTDLDWYLIGGDETALPAIGRWLEGLPAGARAIVRIEVSDAGDELPLVTGADADIRWLHRGDAEAGTTSLLADGLAELTLPPGDGFAWFAGEAGSLRAVRRHLREVVELPAERVDVSGYWKRGVAEHDHHEPIEE